MAIVVRLLGILVASSLLAAGCASRGPAVPQPFPTPGGRPGRPGPSRPDTPARPGADPSGADPAAAESGGIITPGLFPASSALIQSLLATALHYVGTPYRSGGATPDGFDCSGFVYYVFAQQGVYVPRTVSDQASAGQRVREVQAGDLVFFRTGGRKATHVGIALGPDRFVHAPNSRGEVRIEPLARRYWADRFIEARRLFY